MVAALKLQDFDDPDYDPFTADEINIGDHPDPYATIAGWREQAPVVEGCYRELMGLGPRSDASPRVFMIVGSREVAEALANPGRFSNAVYKANIGITFGQGSLSTLDNPEHGRWRKIFQKIFLPQYVKKWGNTIVDPVVRGLMDRFIPRGRADLIQEFTLRYPFEIIYRQLALPDSDVRAFQRLALGQTDFMRMDTAVEAGKKLGAYFTALVDERRANPGDDLVSLLATTRVDGDYLPELVLVSFLRQLMNAGGDTTYRGTSVLLTALLQNPDQLAAIRADPALIPQAIEEALRWDGPVVTQSRMATVDTEIGGVHIPAGSTVEVVAGAANRDPAIYPDPDRFDIFRERKPHFSFSRGPHICVGQHLARFEMTRAMHAVLENLPKLRLDPDAPKPEIRGAMMRVPRNLFVRFDH